MFTAAPMRELNLFVHNKDIVPLTATLARLGAIQIEEETGKPNASATSHWVGLANAYTLQERRAAELLNILGIATQPSSLPDQFDIQRELSVTTTALDEIKEAVDLWQQQNREAIHERDRLHLVAEQLRLLAPLDIPVEKLAHLSRLHLTVGIMPTTNLNRLQTSLFRIPFVIIPTYEYGSRTLVFAATTQEDGPILDRALRSAFFEPIPLPKDVNGLPAQALNILEQQRTVIEMRLEVLQQEQQKLVVAWSETLLASWNRAHMGSVLANAIHHFPLQGQIYLIAGWVPATALERVVDAVQTVTEGRAIIEVLEPSSGHAQVPTLLRNPTWLRGFESLVTNFGFPAYDEIDPTLLLAFSFIIMFGIMFGDAGHGLLLSLAGIWLVLRKGNLAQVAPILLISGLSATCFGLLYGVAFGQPLMPPLWLRPMESIIELLGYTVAGGILLLNVGFVTNMIAAWRKRDWYRLFLDSNGVAGFWLYWALLGGALATWLHVPVPSLVLKLLIIVPALLLFLREPLSNLVTGRRPFVEGGWGGYLVLAFFELFEALLSYISNSLSFVRLGAFAVAHEGLSQVIFILAGLSGSLGWVVIVLGTLFLIGFEGLIVAIQTVRLEYYEFFGKFYRGNGHAFAPFRLLDNDPT